MRLQNAGLAVRRVKARIGQGVAVCLLGSCNALLSMSGSKSAGLNTMNG